MNRFGKMDSSSWDGLDKDDRSSSPFSDILEKTEKLRFCFVCASGIQNNLNQDEEEQLERPSTEILLEVFLKGVDIFCEAFKIDKKPFSRDDEWKQFAELDNFVRYICCSQCCSLLRDVVSLHELILSTERRLSEHLSTIKNHIVDSSQRRSSDKIEYFDQSCIQFRKDVVKKFHKPLKESADTQHLNVESNSDCEGVNTEISISRCHSKAQQKAKRSKRFTRPPCEKEDGSHYQILIKREKNESRDSDDSESFNHLDFSCEDKEDTPTGNDDNGDEVYSNNPNSDNDNDFECEKESESESSASEDEDFIPYVKRRKALKKDPLELCEEPAPLNETEALPLKRKRGRPRKCLERPVNAGKISEQHPDTQDLHVHEKRKRGRPRKSQERPVAAGRSSEPQPDTQDLQGPVKRKRGRPKIYPQGHACETNETKSKVINLQESDNLQLASDDSTRTPVISEDNIPIDISIGNGYSTVSNPLSSSVRKGKKPTKMYQKMWRTKGHLLQHGPNARPILVLNSSTGEMSYLHVKIQLQKPVLYCRHPECNFSVNNVISFSEQEAFLEIKLHIRDKHRKCFRSTVSGAEGGYCCYYCDSTFSSRAEVYDHSRSQHPNLKLPLSLCEICGKVLQQKCMFLHVLRHKSVPEKSEVSKIRLRRKTFKGRPRKQQPSYSKPENGTIIEPLNGDEPTEYRCDLCHKVFSGITVFRRHQTTHINVALRKQYECDICHAKLTSATSLMYHKDSVHTKTAFFTCSYCGRGFPRNQMTCYKTHVRLHTGERPYQCSICGNSFVSKQLLKAHESTHEDTQIQCEYCPNWYKNQRTLSRHQKNRHSEYMGGSTKEKSGICPKSMRLDQRPDFIGPRLAYPCEPCGKVFRWKSVLVAHMKTKHKLHLPSPDDYPNQNILQSVIDIDF